MIVMHESHLQTTTGRCVKPHHDTYSEHYGSTPVKKGKKRRSGLDMDADGKAATQYSATVHFTYQFVPCILKKSLILSAVEVLVPNRGTCRDVRYQLINVQIGKSRKRAHRVKLQFNLTPHFNL